MLQQLVAVADAILFIFADHFSIHIEPFAEVNGRTIHQVKHALLGSDAQIPGIAPCLVAKVAGIGISLVEISGDQ